MTTWKDMTPEQKANKRRVAKAWRKNSPKGQAYMDRSRESARGERARKYALKSRYKDDAGGLRRHAGKAKRGLRHLWECQTNDDPFNWRAQYYFKTGPQGFKGLIT